MSKGGGREGTRVPSSPRVPAFTRTRNQIRVTVPGLVVAPVRIIVMVAARSTATGTCAPAARTFAAARSLTGTARTLATA